MHQFTLSYKDEVLPWFCGIFLGRKQTSDMRVSEVCPELIHALNNRLITVYRSPLLKRDEVLVKCTTRGKKILDKNISIHIQFQPEIGCDDQSLDRYFASAMQIREGELVDIGAQHSVLDVIFDQI